MATHGLDTFATEARLFADWAASSSEPKMTVHAALVRIVSLYRAAFLLPQPWSAGLEVDVPDVEPPAGALEVVKARAAELPFHFYWEVFDPFQDPQPEPVGGHIADDISDIYRDVARGLVLFDAGRRDEALWEWGFNFRIHWGEHATGAIRALHAFLAQEQPDGLSRDA